MAVAELMNATGATGIPTGEQGFFFFEDELETFPDDRLDDP